DPNVVLTANGTSQPPPSIVIQAPIVNFGDNTSIITDKNTGTAISFQTNGDDILRPLTLNFQGTTTILAGGGTGKSRVQISLGSGPSALTQILTLQSVDENGVASTDTHNLLSNAPFLINIPNGTFVDNHIAFTTSTPKPEASSGIGNLAAITITSGTPGFGSTGDLILTGTSGPISVTGSGGPTILIQSRGANSFVNINSSYTFNAGSGGEVQIRKLNVINDDPTGGIKLADGVTLTVSGGSALKFVGPTVQFGSLSLVETSG